MKVIGILLIILGILGIVMGMMMFGDIDKNHRCSLHLWFFLYKNYLFSVVVCEESVVCVDSVVFSVV